MSEANPSQGSQSGRTSRLRSAMKWLTLGLAFVLAVLVGLTVPSIMFVERAYRKTRVDWHVHHPPGLTPQEIDGLGGADLVVKKFSRYVGIPILAAPRRKFALETLVEMGHGAEAVPALIGLLREDDPEAARQLAKVKDPRAVQPLIEALGSGNPFMRSAAADALGAVGDQRAIGSLERALQANQVKHVREAVERALAKLRRASP